MNFKPLPVNLLAVALVASYAGEAFAQATVTYTYDPLGRLTVVNAANGDTTQYTYDAAGNRTQMVTATAGAAPSVSNVSSAVPHNTATAIALLVGGTYTSVAVPSGPSHGSTSISGTTITYTPTANYSGPDSFTYTATNSSGTSAVATVSITVASLSAFTQTIQVTGSGPVNLRTLADNASYSGSQNATITFEVGNGVTIMGDPGGGIGLDTGTWPSGYTISLSLVVKSGGAVYGGGGNGGAGGATWAEPASSGTPGGDAIYARVPIGVTVQSGGIIAGGGNGGEGGAGIDWWHPDYYDQYLGGGGGGGGFPNGYGGPGGYTSNPYFSGSPGNAGSDGTTGGGGAGGAGLSDSYYSQSGGAGASSGYWGYAIRKNGHAVSLSNAGSVSGTVN